MTDRPDIEFERALLRADIKAGNVDAAEAQYQRVLEAEEREDCDEVEDA